MTLAKDDDDCISIFKTEDYLTTASICSSVVSSCKEPVARPLHLFERATGRTHVLNEFLASEITYVNLLREFEDIYIAKAYDSLTIQSAGKLSPKVTFGTALKPDERKTMFKGHEEITKLHSDTLLPKFHAAIDELYEVGDNTSGERSHAAAQQVCKTFCNYIECLKMYSAYSAVCDQANAKYGQWISGKGMARMDRKRVQAYLHYCTTDERHSQIDMTGYLLLPVQRLTRYKMLLQQLEKFTPAPAPGRRDWVGEALIRISNILLYVNEYKREVDSRLRLCHWADQIALSGPSPLVQPHRILVREGPVNFIARGEQTVGLVTGNSNREKMKRTVAVVNKMCLAVLCHDMLVLAQIIGEGRKSKLELMDVVRLSSIGEARLQFDNIIAFEAYDVSYYLQVDTNKIAQGWVEAINEYRWK
nr:hypothetical protein L203_01424 [Cryptococcus depauperatus CBS 7841]ODN95475.1 hypothetical protein L204_04015 [Cryptococcus depauperatus CBS 7855]